ncbi:hypothetical protein INN71_15620 [Nocardioides sp. ChNu-153]|uniref:hypothetical protein n=1 Tax=Nocardioides sp. ChNu-153 TaxID=2779364 RepID=UPI002655E084|nr:hypothetical protein [Nocardioides sp. ChNu-153]MDN7122819.1 hypothetical protein [Nocardioides sp. ChNu-153]
MPAHDVLVVPGVPALLPEHAGLVDPVADLRAAVRAAVPGLVGEPPQPVTVLASPPTPAEVRRSAGPAVGLRVARHLLAEAGATDVREVDARVAGEVPADAGRLLVVANGSATRTEKAPGHLDERAEGFDAAVGAALASADAQALAGLDLALAAALWADVAPLAALGRHLAAVAATGLTWTAQVLHDDAPYGVQYWVVRLRAA